MPTVECARCRSQAEGLPEAPLPGEAGERVASRTCVACWKEWLAAQVILINEHSLSPVNPDHYNRLLEEMGDFLKLND